MFTFELADCVELKVICVSVPSLASVTASSANFAVEIYGHWIIPTVMAKLEKMILANAQKIGLKLEWNSNKG